MPDFNKYSLYESRALLTELERRAGEIQAIGEILTDRAGIQMSLLKQLALVANNQALNIFLDIYEHQPINYKQLNQVFPSSTLNRILPLLEAAGVIIYRNGVYRIHRKEPDKKGES